MALLILAVGGRAQAQRPEAVRFVSVGGSQAAADSVRFAPNYADEGALFGGAGFALMGAVAATTWCKSSETGCASYLLSAAGGAILLGGIGFMLGGIVGSLIPKP